LVEHRVTLYDRKWKPETLQYAIENLRAEWKPDLRPLLPQFVPYELAGERVEVLLK